MEKVLVYCGADLDKKSAVSILQTLGMNPVIIKDSDLGQTLGYLAGRDGFEKTESIVSESFPQSFMILDQVEDERILAISKAFEAAGKPYRGIKAMVTEHNQHWKMIDLFHEVQLEHAYFEELGNLQRLLQEVNAYQPNDYTETSWMSFQAAMLEAYMIYQSRPEKITELTKAKEQLRYAMDQLETV